MIEVFLIQPLGKLDQPSGFMRTCSLEPLALEYLQSALEEINISSQIFYGKINEQELYDEIKKKKPIAICFSVYTYQYSYCLYLANHIKQLSYTLGYSSSIIFGGYHSSAMPEDILKNSQVDYVIIGEGERTLQELVSQIIINGNIETIKGLCYKTNKSFFYTGSRNRIDDIDSIPSPTRHQSILSNTGQYQITLPSPSKQINVAQVTYSRGCPYSCIFCSSENMWGKSVVWRNPIKVVDEIEALYEKYGTNLIYFPDLTFNVNKLKVYNICNEFVKRNLPVHWWGLFRLDRLENDMLYALKEAKCVKLSIGFETGDDNTANMVKGDYLVRKDQYKDLLYTANDIGLIIKAFLIIGFPDDTEEKIKRYHNFLFDNPIDEIRVTFITPFPGTKIWDEYIQKGLISENINLDMFTTEIPVINHHHLNKNELLKLRLDLIRNFYLDPRYANHVKEKTKKYPNLKDSYFEYFGFLKEKGIFSIDEPIFSFSIEDIEYFTPVSL